MCKKCVIWSATLECENDWKCRIMHADPQFMFSLVCQVSDTSPFGLWKLEGRVTVCDTLARKITTEPFENFFARCADEPLPPGGQVR